MTDSYRKINKIRQTHPLFKMQEVEQKFSWSGQVWVHREYQCPLCKIWFVSHSSAGTGGLLFHISRIAKSESVAKQLKEIKETPHFDFWKENTEPRNNLYKPREWRIY